MLGVAADRIRKARKTWPFGRTHADILVRHADTCGIFPPYAEMGPTGKPCDCDPDIEVILADGRRALILTDGLILNCNVP